jgi:hypothetical protein
MTEEVSNISIQDSNKSNKGIQFGIHRSEVSRTTDLMIVPHASGPLVVNYPPFGPGIYDDLAIESSKRHYHNYKLTDARFNLTQTPQSLSVLAYMSKHNLEDYQDFLHEGVLLGTALYTNGGIFVNLPKEGKEVITDISRLQALITPEQKIKSDAGIPVINQQGLGFYSGPQEHGIINRENFIRSGLGRLIEGSNSNSLNQILEENTYIALETTQGIKGIYLINSEKPKIFIVDPAYQKAFAFGNLIR